MPLGESDNQPIKVPLQDALNAAWMKIGQLGFMMDIMTKQMTALENENKELKAKLEKAK